MNGKPLLSYVDSDDIEKIKDNYYQFLNLKNRHQYQIFGFNFYLFVSGQAKLFGYDLNSNLKYAGIEIENINKPEWILLLKPARPLWKPLENAQIFELIGKELENNSETIKAEQQSLFENEF